MLVKRDAPRNAVIVHETKLRLHLVGVKSDILHNRRNHFQVVVGLRRAKRHLFAVGFCKHLLSKLSRTRDMRRVIFWSCFDWLLISCLKCSMRETRPCDASDNRIA